jgi:hypothetical protein
MATVSNQTPTFQDKFTSLSLHKDWQPGDNWMLIAPDTPYGRGGPNSNEAGDQWWTNPFNPNTPVDGLYSLAPGGGLQLGLLSTPAAVQAYIDGQAGKHMPFVGCIMNSYPVSYQKYGYWQVTASVPAVPGTSFQADTENVQITGTWPPEIDLRISTDSSGVQTVLFDVATRSGTKTWTTSSNAGFDATASHAYGWDWESDNITFYIDHQQVWQVATPQDGTYTTNPMFMFLLSGANYINNGDPNPGSLPFHALVSDVSVYKSMPTFSGNPSPSPASADNTVVMNGSAAAITDATGNRWTLANGVVQVNGAPAGYSANTSEIAYVGGTVWQKNASNLWWSWTGNAWSAGNGTTTSPLRSDRLMLRVSEDAYQGNANFTMSVDGHQVGGTMTASALHAMGDSDVISVAGTWGIGAHDVKVQFLNDAYGGNVDADRNLYVDSIAYNGVTYAGTSAMLASNGTKDFAIGGSAASANGPPDSLTLHLAEDAWNGDANFTLSIDGKTISAARPVVTPHSGGAWQDLTFSGRFGGGSHDVGITFTNDSYGGSPAADRNLYVAGVDFNGTHYGNGVTSLLSNGTAHFII